MKMMTRISRRLMVRSIHEKRFNHPKDDLWK